MSLPQATAIQKLAAFQSRFEKSGCSTNWTVHVMLARRFISSVYLAARAMHLSTSTFPVISLGHCKILLLITRHSSRLQAARLLIIQNRTVCCPFDKLSSVFLSNTNHEEDQPCHLTLADPDMPIRDNLPMYDEPAQRYCSCPAYMRLLKKTSGPRVFRSMRRNCVHCKTCDIKDPSQNITWVDA